MLDSGRLLLVGDGSNVIESVRAGSGVHNSANGATYSLWGLLPFRPISLHRGRVRHIETEAWVDRFSILVLSTWFMLSLLGWGSFGGGL
jgi:hypothetical protein